MPHGSHHPVRAIGLSVAVVMCCGGDEPKPRGEEGERRGLVSPARLRLVRLPGHELRPREQRPLPLRGVIAGLVRACIGGNGLGLDDGGLRLGRVPAVVDEQRLGLRRDLPRLLEDRLDGAGVLLARDVLPRQGEHQVVAVGGEAVLGQLTLDGQRRLELLGHQLEGVRLQGVPVGHEDDPHGLGLADAPGVP